MLYTRTTTISKNPKTPREYDNERERKEVRLQNKDY